MPGRPSRDTVNGSICRPSWQGSGGTHALRGWLPLPLPQLPPRDSDGTTSVLAGVSIGPRTLQAPGQAPASHAQLHPWYLAWTARPRILKLCVPLCATPKLRRLWASFSPDSHVPDSFGALSSRPSDSHSSHLCPYSSQDASFPFLLFPWVRFPLQVSPVLPELWARGRFHPYSVPLPHTHPDLSCQ